MRNPGVPSALRRIGMRCFIRPLMSLIAWAIAVSISRCSMADKNRFQQGVISTCGLNAGEPAPMAGR